MKLKKKQKKELHVISLECLDWYCVLSYENYYFQGNKLTWSRSALINATWFWKM